MFNQIVHKYVHRTETCIVNEQNDLISYQIIFLLLSFIIIILKKLYFVCVVCVVVVDVVGFIAKKKLKKN